MEDNQILLKTRLQGLGPLRSGAWERILQSMRTAQIRPGESFIRDEGTLAYLSNGLLKEYDVQHRKTPSIINFIRTGQPLATRRHNQINYLKACVHTEIYFWDFKSLLDLYQEFSELKLIYDALCADYDLSISFRQLILEEKTTTRKIELFIHRYKEVLVLLKKKDIANYLHLDYDYFVRNYHRIMRILLAVVIPGLTI